MKRVIYFIAAALTLLPVMPAQAEGCWYYETYGCHVYEQVDAAKPTCKSDGYYLLECTVCGHSQKEITDKAYGHDWRRTDEKQSTCTSRGTTTYECRNCGDTKTEKLDRLPHEYGAWKTARQAGELSCGVRYRVCTECGYTDEEDFYPEGALYRSIKDKYAVKNMQQKLIDMGYLHDDADGVFGKNTERAVRDYAAYAGFPEDGVAWPGLLDSMNTDWNIYMGYDTEPGDDGLEGNMLVDVCIYGNSSEWVNCAVHADLLEMTRTLRQSVMTDGDYLRSIRQIRALWQSELEALYDEWIANAPAEEKNFARLSRMAFLNHMAAQENAWKQHYGADSHEVTERACRALSEQCMQLCGMACSIEYADGE